MSGAGEQMLLRIFIRNTLKYSWWCSAADALLRRAIRRGLAGETTLEGFLGLDSAGQVIEPGRWSLVQTRPLILEFLDSPEAIRSFLPDAVEVVKAGLATLEPVLVSAHRRKQDGGAAIAGLNPAAHVPNPEIPIMQNTIDGQLLRIYIDESDQLAGKPLYRVVIDKARGLGMSNAIVLRASTGFGTHRRVHTERSPDYDTERPIVVEIAGAVGEISRLLPVLEELIPEGLVTIEDVKMLRLGSKTGN